MDFRTCALGVLTCGIVVRRFRICEGGLVGLRLYKYLFIWKTMVGFWGLVSHCGSG